MRTLTEIQADILALEQESKGLLRKIVGQHPSMVATTLTVYADPSVIGACEDDEFGRPSRMLMDRFTLGDMTLALSPLTLRELDSAPKRVRDILDAVPPQHIEMVDVSHEAEQLAGTLS